MAGTLCLDCGRSIRREGVNRCHYCAEGRKGGEVELNTVVYRRLREKVQRGEHGPCRDCGATHLEVTLTVEHLVPRVDGGTLADGWLVLCLPCNSRRGAGVGARRRRRSP